MKKGPPWERRPFSRPVARAGMALGTGYRRKPLAGRTAAADSVTWSMDPAHTAAYPGSDTRNDARTITERCDGFSIDA